MLYIGIDLGTSAVKLLLMDQEGTVQNVVSKEYPLEFPQPGWSQQNPEDWKAAVLEGVPALLDGFDKSQVAGTGPNDLVAVVLSDKSGKPFGPVRIGVDLTFALVGFALGGVVGIGTIICAFLVGPAAQLFFPVSEKICVCVLNQFAGANSRS